MAHLLLIHQLQRVQQEEKLTIQPPLFFIQFSGQGEKYIDELRQLYLNNPDIRPFINEANAEIKRQASICDDKYTGFFEQGLDIDRWIDHPEETPDAGYLLSSPISHPLIFLCQISNYISMIQNGMDQDLLMSRCHGATGFSTGVVAAVLVSMCLPLEDLCSMAIKVQAMFFWQGIRTQQSMLQLPQRVMPKLAAELFDTPEGCPSCMASVSGLSRSRLDDIICSFSSRKNGIVYPAYELRSDRWIVSGLPEDLAEFNEFLKEQERDIGWRYIPSTIAAHSPYLSYAAFESMPQDVKRIGLEFRGDRMQIPVLATDDGTDLRSHENILIDVMRAYFMREGSWRNQIASLFGHDPITYVLSFGPGSGLASLTESYVTGSGIQVIRCALPIYRERLLEEILPPLNLFWKPLDHVRLLWTPEISTSIAPDKRINGTRPMIR